MKTLTRIQRRAAFAAATAGLMLLSTTPLLTQTPRCGHIILITAPAHASSWFLRSVESCSNNTIDIKPTTEVPSSNLLSRSLRLTKIDERLPAWIARFEAPVVVLRRDVPGAYRQFVEGGDVAAWSDWERSVDSFFADVDKLLREQRVEADWIWYNDVVAKRRFYLNRAACYVDNCDYLR